MNNRLGPLQYFCMPDRDAEPANHKTNGKAVNGFHYFAGNGEEAENNGTEVRDRLPRSIVLAQALRDEPELIMLHGVKQEEGHNKSTVAQQIASILELGKRWEEDEEEELVQGILSHAEAYDQNE